MKTKCIKQSGFKFGWQKIYVKPQIAIDGYFAMKDWQERAYALLHLEPHMIVNAPMGSGKTWLICWLSVFKLMKDASLRCIIAVPQHLIANGFREARLILPDGSKFHWFAQHNLCNQDDQIEGTTKYVMKWLEGPYGMIQDRILLCSHMTLVAVHKRLKEQGRLDLLKNLLVWIDEAHHLKNALANGFTDALISNGIGELVAYLLAHTKDNIQVGLATASFFRGDRCTLLTEEMEKKFIRFNLPYDEYLKSMQHLKSFSLDFLFCGRDYANAIEMLAKHRKAKDIIHIPHPMSRYSTKDKYKEVEDIVGRYRKVHGGTIKNTNGLTVLKKKDTSFIGIDLVDEDQRPEKKEYIANIKGKDDLDFVVALGMFKEGANWIWADRSVIVGARSSLVDIIQIVFNEHQGYDCIVHFHCPIKEESVIPQVSQREYECGSHECGQNTSRGLTQFGNLLAVYLQEHGPNIVFNRNINPQEVIDFIEANFDLNEKTGGPVTLKQIRETFNTVESLAKVVEG